MKNSFIVSLFLLSTHLLAQEHLGSDVGTFNDGPTADQGVALSGGSSHCKNCSATVKTDNVEKYEYNNDVILKTKTTKK